ncbi:chromate transporter [Mesomycoplasma hyopneumoniae]|uniref:Chromate transport protein, putative n=2 Tax=Mesomycoplasma hyopneumoniae (strain 168) TaxID=907287 RepID=E4QSG2_MESH1|nr:chromate transporter [Mesomycoplasma hyopneumoniae]ADQ90373.1 Chromate transport protein, putative [Mesomycoplasma hyopneumoniae 168]AGM21940.1 Chromate transport protein, putative [Mesomycoplasma hyopneumoniae 168-L]OWY73939.1 chromate transporter [Mesomycoplasma hyopneumoniae]
MILIISLAIIGLVLISLLVFGGGQVFMPVFSWFWEQLAHLGLKIDQEQISQIFTIANSTPGVISLKLAGITGFLIGDYGVLGWFLAIFFIIIFILPAIFLIIFWLRISKKIAVKNNVFWINLIKIFRPVIVGIILALAFQLLTNLIFINYSFNSSKGYFLTKKSSEFLEGWRFWVFIFFGTSWTIIVFISYLKKKNIFLLIILGIILALTCLQPWI